MTEGDTRERALRAATEWAPERGLFIGGEWVGSALGESRDVIDPSTGDVVRRVAEAGERGRRPRRRGRPPCAPGSVG